MSLPYRYYKPIRPNESDYDKLYHYENLNNYNRIIGV